MVMLALVERVIHKQDYRETSLKEIQYAWTHYHRLRDEAEEEMFCIAFLEFDEVCA